MRASCGCQRRVDRSLRARDPMDDEEDVQHRASLARSSFSTPTSPGGHREHRCGYRAGPLRPRPSGHLRVMLACCAIRRAQPHPGNMSEPTWLMIARELQAIAQTGLAYTDNGFDRERYERVRELAASLMAEGSGADREKILELFRQDLGYATPKIDVRGAAFVDGRILMVREVSDGLWTLPGGWADVNQSAAECVVREFEEESGFTVSALKLAAI